MKKLILILCSINLLSAPSNSENALEIIHRKNIDLETRSLVSWNRFFSSKERIKKTTYNLNDDEIRILKSYIKLKIRERNKNLSVGI